MKAIVRRVRNIENKLHVGKGQQGRLIVLRRAGAEQGLPEPIEEWVTYKQAMANCWPVGVFCVDPAKELEARENLQKAAEGQGHE